MTISYPRDLPANRIASCRIRAKRRVARAPLRGGGVQAVELGPAVWEADYETAPLSRAQAAEWESWLDTLRGGTQLFKGRDPRRSYARAYPAGYGALTVSGSPFTGSGTLSSVASGGAVVTLGALPVSFVLSVGDQLSVAFSGRQHFHRVSEAGTANGSGVASVAIEPFLPAGYSGGEAVLLLRPWFLASVDEDSIDVSSDIGGRTRVSFSASQVFA